MVTATYSGSVTARPGIIDTQNDVGGWPAYNSAVAPVDTNADGIPDGWLEINYPGKMANDLTSDGYTYLEVYLDSLVKNITEGQNTDAVVAGINQLTLNNDPEIYAAYNVATKSVVVKSTEVMNELYIREITGKTIKIIAVDAQDFSIDVSSLNSGIYLISVFCHQAGTKTIKIAF